MFVFKHNAQIDYTKFGPMPIQQALKGIICNMYEDALPEIIIDIDSFSDIDEYKKFADILLITFLEDPTLFVLYKDDTYYYLLAKYDISDKVYYGSYGMITKHSIKSKAFSAEHVKDLFQIICDYIYYAGIRVKS